MKRFYGAVVGVLLAGAAQAQDGPPPGGTDLIMKAVTVQGQNQLRGRYGSAWEAGEVRTEAAKTCAENGMRMIYFKPGKTDRKGRTEFAAVCK